jgi:ATP-binding cassette subfamily B protein
MTKSSSTTQTIKLYWHHVWRYPGLAIGVLLSIPLTTLVNTFLPPLVIAHVFNQLNNTAVHHTMSDFTGSIILYVCLSLSGTITWRIVDVFAWRLEANVEKDLARRVYAHLLGQSANFHANSFGGSLVSQTSKILGAYIRVADTTIYQVMPLLWGLLFTAVILIGRAPLFVVAFVLFSTFYMLTASLVTKESRRLSAIHAANESSQTGYLADSVTNVMAIKSFAGSNYEKQEFDKVTSKTRGSLLAWMKAMQKQFLYFSAMTRTIQVLALVLGIVGVVVYKANIGTIFLVLSYTAAIAEELFTFSNNSLRNYNRSFGDASEMVGILQVEPEVKDPVQPEPAHIKEGSIDFVDVTFTHDGSNDVLFENLDISIQQGEKVGLVGHSGSGKTTFTRLLLRFSDIDGGNILVDGQDIASITQDDLHKGIAYVPQEPIMFHRSLSDNIRYGNFKAKQSEIEKAARVAHAHDFIRQLPDGYDTLVGERGVKLSGGQRQRIAIARAMLKNAPILVLDEATSALDSESEVLIQDALWKLMEGRTAIVIAHRLSTIQKMDRIIVLDNGKITEEGSHKELLNKKGTYAKLWEHQSGGFIEE